MDSSEEEPKVAKKKKQLTEKQLEQLAKAREKGNAVRKQNAEAKRKERELAQLSKQAKAKEVEEQLEQIKSTPKSKQSNLKPKRVAPAKSVHKHLEDDEFSESDSGVTPALAPSPSPSQRPRR